jgi:CheY-like chemotaxis protein
MNAFRTMLLVDDSENDLLLLETALEQADFGCRVKKVYDGREAIAYLGGEGKYRDRNEYPIPAGVLLDLNMPQMSGFEVLSWVQGRPELQKISFVILTASLRMQDVQQASDLGAHSYLVKPASLRELVSMLRALRQWLKINQCPPGNLWVSGGP